MWKSVIVWPDRIGETRDIEDESIERYRTEARLKETWQIVIDQLDFVAFTQQVHRPSHWIMAIYWRVR